ncbi:MAG: GAF domain-containing protein [Chloroflexi bacterium]|nr:MAG: GAF domain-containing protein [Chloroflexota bacterium]
MAGEKILIIEDDADQSRMMALWLDQSGYETITARDGMEGLEKALHERPDLILLDIRLPKLPGIQLLQALSSHGFTPPTIVVTAYSSDEIAIQALRLGVRDYIRKPFNLDDLLNAVRRVLGEARLRQERDAFFEELEQRVEELTRLQQISLRLGQMSLGTAIEDIYRKLNEQAATLLDAEMSAILLYDAEHERLVYRPPGYGVPDGVLRDYFIPLRRNAQIWRAWQAGFPMIINDVFTSPLVRALGLDRLARRVGVRSTILAVIRAGGSPIGALQVSNKRNEMGFTEADARVLEIFSAQGGIAIQNARLLQRLKTLHQISEALTSRLEQEAVLNRVLQGVREVLPVEGVSIWLTAPQPGGRPPVLRLVATHSPSLGSRFPNIQLAVGEGIAGWVVRTGKSALVPDVRQDERFSPQLDRMTGFQTKSLLCVPLIGRKEVIGVIEVVNKIGGMFDQEDEDLLRLVAASVAVAVENARLFDEERRRIQEMEALLEVGQAVTEAVSEHPKRVLEQIVKGACEVVGADCAVIYPYVSGRSDIYDVQNVATYGTRHPLSLTEGGTATRDPADRVRQKGVLCYEDLEREAPELLNTPFIAREQIRAFAGFYLAVGDHPLGILYVNFRQPHPFNEDELTTLRLFANQAALAIDKSRLFEKLNQDLFQANLELERANAELRRKIRELEELQKIDKAITSILDINEVLDRILQGALDIIGAPYGNITLLDQDAGEVISRVGRGMHKKSTIRFRLQEIGVAYLARKKRPVIIPDVTRSPWRDWPWADWYHRTMPEARSALLVPILSGPQGEPIGAIHIGSPRPSAFTQDDGRLLEALAGQAAIAIQNARYLEALQESQRRRIEAERLAAMADLASNMVHRINNSVGAIRAMLQQIELKMTQGALTHAYLQDKLRAIQESAEQTLEIARRIRRPFQPMTREPIQVNQAIARAWEDVSSVPPGITVIEEYAEDLPAVLATPQLSEVFLNLITNALEAMGEQGTLRIRTEQTDDRWVSVYVSDTGPGIPKDRQEEIFRMGTTTKKGGLGYGLWWSRTFMQRLGGDISVESEVGKGSTFIVRIPVLRRSPDV